MAVVTKVGAETKQVIAVQDDKFFYRAWKLQRIQAWVQSFGKAVAFGHRAGGTSALRSIGRLTSAFHGQLASVT